MRAKLIPIFLGLVMPIQLSGVLAQQSRVTTNPVPPRTRSLRSNLPNRIAFVSEIGGVPSVYVADPDHSDVNHWGEVKINNLLIPHHDLVFSPDRTKVMFVASEPIARNPALWIANTNGSGARRLIDWEWITQSPFHAAWSPAGDRVAFVASTQDTTQIYLMNLDGSNLRSVAVGDNFSWSPDGKRLAFTGYLSQQTGRFAYVINIDGTNLRQVSNSGTAVQCSWSPDGKLIAISEDRLDAASESRFNVFVIQPDGRGQKRVLENVPLYSRLSWSPRGALLSFVTTLQGKQGLYVWSARVTTAQRQRFFSEVDARFDWSPDGKQIAYGAVGRVSLLNAVTGKIQELFHTSGFGRPLWFPNGKRLLLQHTESIWRHTIQSPELDFWTTNLEPRFINRLTDEALVVTGLSVSPTGSHIAFGASTNVHDSSANSAYVINPDGSRLRKLPATFVHSEWFAWSADGTKIAFVKETSPNNRQIYVANADGSGEQILVDDPSWNFAPAWLPDGKSIMFISNRENGHAIYSVDVESKRIRRVFDISSSINPPVATGTRRPFRSLLWSPDATKLAVQLEKSIFIIDLTKTAVVVRYNGVAPSLQSWTPDSQRIVVTDLPYRMGMGPLIMDSMAPFSSFEVDASDGKISRPDYLTIERRAIPRLQVSKVAWRSDAERLAVSDSFGGIWVVSANGSDRRPFMRGSQPAWVR